MYFLDGLLIFLGYMFSKYFFSGVWPHRIISKNNLRKIAIIFYQFKHLFWVLKRTVSSRNTQRMFWLRNKKTNFSVYPSYLGPGQESNSSDPDHNRGYLGSDKADLHTNNTCADPEGWQEVRTPLYYHKNIGFLSKTGPYPLKNHKATKPAFNVGPSSACQRNDI